MSIYRPQELRYAKLDSLEQERALMNNYWNDIIRIHGYDVEYYRLDTEYAKSGGIDSETIYGYKDNPKYSHKSNLRAFVDVGEYNFILNGEGFNPSDKVTIYFGINDFAVSFVDEIGKFKNYTVSSSTGYVNLKNGTISVPFSSDVMSGTATLEITASEKKYDVPAEIAHASVPCYSVAFNPFIYRSFTTDYRDGYYSANILLDYDSTRGNRVQYTVHGDILYSNFFEDERLITEIHPNAGDIVEIDYKTPDGIKEQYEITEVISRKPTNMDGLSPFVGKYVYKCSAVRRIASEFDGLEPEDASQEAKDNIMDYSKRRADSTDTDSTDWSSSSADYSSNYYGGYSKADGYKSITETLSGNRIQEIFDYDQWKMDWPDCETVSSGIYSIATFTDNTSLFTDGINLYWGDGTISGSTAITTIAASSVEVSADKLPVMMYLSVRGGQIAYTTADGATTKILTNFSNPLDDGMNGEYVDGFTYKDVGYVNNDGYYIFKNSRIAINSFGGRELIAVADGGNEPVKLATR